MIVNGLEKEGKIISAENGIETFYESSFPGNIISSVN